MKGHGVPRVSATRTWRGSRRRNPREGAVVARVLLVVGILSLGLALVAGSLFIQRGLKPPWYEPGNPGGTLPTPAADSALFETWMGRSRDPHAEYGYAFEAVSFPTEGDDVLRGWYIPATSADRAIVTAHGCGTDRRGLLKILPILHEAGYHVLMFDAREHGVSDGNGRGCSAGVREHRDILAAIEFLVHERDITEVALVGASQGASAVLMAAPQSDTVRALVVESPFVDLQTLLEDGGVPGWLAGPLASATLLSQRGARVLSPIERARQIEVPTLVMHGGRDRTVPPRHGKAVYDALGSVEKELWMPEDAHHVHLYNLEPQAYAERLRAFLESHFPIPSAPKGSESTDSRRSSMPAAVDATTKKE